MRFTWRVDGRKHATLRIEFTPSPGDIADILATDAVERASVTEVADVCEALPRTRRGVEAAVHDFYFAWGADGTSDRASNWDRTEVANYDIAYGAAVEILERIYGADLFARREASR